MEMPLTCRFGRFAICVCVVFVLEFGKPSLLLAASSKELPLQLTLELNTESVTVGGMEDRDGILWFATAIGPMRYNGQTLSRVHSSAQFGNLRVASLFESRDGRIWMGYVSGGVVVHDKDSNSYDVYQHDPEQLDTLSSDRLNWTPHLINEDASGGIWIGTDNGLNRLDPKSGKVKRFMHDPQDPDSIVGNDINAIMVDEQQRVWVATYSGLSVYDSTTGKFTNYIHDADNPRSLPADEVSDIVQLSNGEIWVSTLTQGLALLDLESGEFERVNNSPSDHESQIHNQIYSLMVDQSDTIWIGRNFTIAAGAEQFDPKTRTFDAWYRNPLADEPDSSEAIMSLFQGADGAIWFPYNSGLVYRATPWSAISTIESNSQQSGEQADPALTMAEDERGDIWIGGVAGLSRYNEGSGTHEPWRMLTDNSGASQQRLKFQEINSILPVGQGRLWIGEVDSTFSLVDTERREILKRLTPNDRSFGAWGGVFDSKDPNVIWYGTQTRGLGRIDTLSGEYRFYNNQENVEAGVKVDYIANVALAGSGKLWVMTDGQGLLLFDGEKVIEQYANTTNTETVLTSPIVNDVTFDAEGQLWVATQQTGLNLLDRENQSFRTFTLESGLPTDSVFGIAIDSKGMLWLATDVGLLQFNPRTEEILYQLDERDGLPTRTLLSWPSGLFISSKQQLFVGSLAGLGRVSIPHLNSSKRELRIIFTALGDHRNNVFYDSAAIERVKQIDLYSPETSFDFEVSVLDYMSSFHKEIRYKLDGFDNDWIRSGKQFYGRYTGLRGGSYTLRVQALQEGDKWGAETTLKVVVHPAWWQSLWFVTTAWLVFMALIASLIAWRFMIMKKMLASAKALAANEEYMHDIAKSAYDYFWESDETHRLVNFSARFIEITGLHVSRWYGKRPWELEECCTDMQRMKVHCDDLNAQRPFRDFHLDLLNSRGNVSHLLINGVPNFDESGNFRGYRGTGRDFSSEVIVRREAAKAQTRLLKAIESANASILIFDENDVLVFLHISASDSFDELRQTSGIGIHYLEHVRTGPRANASLSQGMSTDEYVRQRLEHHRHPTTPLEFPLAKNTWLQMHESRLDDGGTLQMWTDTTQLKAQEERLRQSQKMAVIGQLTGGVAHDFNNLLAVIQGNLELLMNRFSENNSEASAYVEAALSAAQKGASLTSQLLASARKQSLNPSIVDINQMMERMVALLQRTLGDKVDVQFKPKAGLWTSIVDVWQLEIAVLNLAINARDAMVDGGTLMIKVRNIVLSARQAALYDDVRPGDYVRLSVIDTGEGMSKAVLDRIFEPFYTTKDVGKGVGLGLSMVHGFIKQSRGHIRINSLPGMGTSVSLYLQRSNQVVGRVRRREPDSKRRKSGSGRSVLVVDDDEGVLQTTARLLNLGGYQVLKAGDSTEALAKLKAHPEIHVMVTDIGLPGGCNGLDLSRLAQQERPGLPTVFMSGNPSIADGGIGAGQRLLFKPFTRSILIAAMQQAIDEAKNHSMNTTAESAAVP